MINSVDDYKHDFIQRLLRMSLDQAYAYGGNCDSDTLQEILAKPITLRG